VVTLKINDINDKVDVPIVLNGVNTIEEYEGEFESRRNITSTLEFTAKTYVYGPVKTAKQILTSEIDIFGDSSNFNGAVTDAHTLRVGITGVLL